MANAKVVKIETVAEHTEMTISVHEEDDEKGKRTTYVGRVLTEDLLKEDHRDWKHVLQEAAATERERRRLELGDFTDLGVGETFRV